MQARLTAMDLREAAAYLGYGGEIPQEIRARMDNMTALIFKEASPLLTYRVFEKNDPILNTILIGKDIEKLLENAPRVLLFGATLGLGIDRTLARLQISDMQNAVLFDALASTAIENVCNNFCSDLGPDITTRFSPGYGDLPFEIQRKIADRLQLDRNIGVTLTEGGVMIPQKSVTAILGLLKGEIP